MFPRENKFKSGFPIEAFYSFSSIDLWRRGPGRGGYFLSVGSQEEGSYTLLLESEFPSPYSSPHSFLAGRG
jgi:hypothetical protein